MSQPDFLYELFEDFMDDPANQDFSMDNGLVCRWMTGQAKISPKISAYYSKPYCTLPLKEIEDTNALLQLASAFYSEADTYRTTVEKIIETVHSHTFAVELAAKLTPLCVKDNGTFVSPDSFKYCARVIHHELGNVLFHAHCLRHTHGTILAEGGVNPKTVMERLGHKDIKTTLQTYTFNTEAMQQKAVEIFEQSLQA